MIVTKILLEQCREKMPSTEAFGLFAGDMLSLERALHNGQDLVQLQRWASNANFHARELARKLEGIVSLLTEVRQQAGE